MNGGLILTRRVGESIVINENIRITNLGIKGHQVRLYIDAPRDIPVHREEIFDKIKKENGALDKNRIKKLKGNVAIDDNLEHLRSLEIDEADEG